MAQNVGDDQKFFVILSRIDAKLCVISHERLTTSQPQNRANAMSAHT